MADVYTGAQDEATIQLVLEKGLGVRGMPKWIVLRLALAHSLHLTTPPDETLDRIEDRKGGSEYHLEQLTGKGQLHDEGTPRRDFDEAICALLSVYHGQDLFADLAAYRRLLQRHMRRGLREIRHGWRESHDFHEFLYQELFAGAGGAVPSGQPELRARLAAALQEIGVTGELREELTGPRLSRFLLHLPDANDLVPLRRGLEKLAFSLGLGEQGIMMSATEEPKVVGLDVPRHRDTWHPIGGHDLRGWVAAHRGEELLPVWPGVDVLGTPYRLDLAAAPHLLVAGTTGSGKSICLHALLLSLLHRQPRERLRLCLIDPKRVELEHYRRLPDLIGGGVVSDVADAAGLLGDLVATLEQRTARLAELGVREVAEAHRRGVDDLPYIVVVVEELADLFLQSRAVEEPLVRLAQKSRAVGIHLVLATQRPDAATFSGLLRSNIPTRIALTVQKASESRIILDQTGAERLTGAGDMLVRTAQGELTRVHGVRVTTDDIAAAIRAFLGERG